MSSTGSEHEEAVASTACVAGAPASSPPSSGRPRSRPARRPPGGCRRRKRLSSGTAAAAADAGASANAVDTKESCRLCVNAEPPPPANEDDDPVSQVEMQLLEGPSGLRAHYLCLLFSSGLHQRGEEDEELRGFLAEDVRAEVRRGNRLKCVYCKRKGATVGCARQQCKKSYHLPCGMRNNSMQQHFDQFKSFCCTHRPTQKVGSSARRSLAECGVCLKEVPEPKASFSLLWAPCCGGWMHRSCIQRQALSSGLHHFRCIYCNDSRVFVREMRNQGIQIPERDASWEGGSEARRFDDLTTPLSLSCSAKICLCTVASGVIRERQRVNKPDGLWEILPCSGCGSKGIHVRCGGLEEYVDPDWYCYVCRKIVGVREGGDSAGREFAKPIKTLWGRAAATKTGLEEKSAVDQKQELFRLIKTMVVPQRRSVASTSAASSSSSVVVPGELKAGEIVHEVSASIRVSRRDVMNITLEDIIKDGLDKQNKRTLLAPPLSSTPLKRKRSSDGGGDRGSSSPGTPPSSVSAEEERSKAASPGDSDYESGKDTPGKGGPTPSKSSAVVPAATPGDYRAKETLDQKIQRSIKDFFLEEKTD